MAEASFADAIAAAVPRLEELEPLPVDMPGLPSGTADLLWQVIETLGVVTNKAKLVAGTKALHHLLPDLVVPMDRAWTGRFFQLHPLEWQDLAAQRRTFRRVYGQLAGLARQVQPGEFADGLGWCTTRTKIIDNALIGYCKTALGGEPGSAPRGNQVTIHVSGYPPAKNEAKSLLSAGHPYLDRVLRLLAAAYQAISSKASLRPRTAPWRSTSSCDPRPARPNPTPPTILAASVMSSKTRPTAAASITSATSPRSGYTATTGRSSRSVTGRPMPASPATPLSCERSMTKPITGRRPRSPDRRRAYSASDNSRSLRAQARPSHVDSDRRIFALHA